MGWSKVAIIFGLLAAMLGVLYWFNENATRTLNDKVVTEPRQIDEQPVQESLTDQQLPRGLTAADYERARRWFIDLYPGKVPDRWDVLSVAGELAVADQEWEIALASFQAIPSDHPRYGLAARLQQGTTALELELAVEAEGALREYLRLAKQAEQVRIDDVVSAYKWLNYILSVQIRLEDRKIVMEEVHRFGLADVLDSKQYFFPNLLILNSPAGRARIQKFLVVDPNNLTLRIAAARYKVLEGLFEEGIDLLEQLAKEVPEDVNVMSALAEALFEANELERFDEVMQQAPEYAVKEPWILTRLRGEQSLQREDFGAAEKHFRAVLENDPANAPSQMGLATALAELGKQGEHELALQRSGILAEIRVNLTNAQVDAVAALEDLADKCRKAEFAAAAEVFAAHSEAAKKTARPMAVEVPQP